jgi:putative membrane protein
MFPMMWGYSSWGAFGFIWMIFWWALIILGIVYLVKWIARQGGSQGKDAVEILKERYARGEINKKEFEEKKRDIA